MKRRLGAVFAVCMLAGTAAAQVALTAADSLGRNDPAQRLTREWLAGIEARASGLLGLTYFPDEQLVKAKDMLDAAQNGVADIVHLVSNHVTDRLPLVSVFALPSPNARADMARLGAAAWALVRSPGFEVAMLKQGVRPIRVVVAPPAQIVAIRPVASLDDLRGLRLRADHATRQTAIVALGGVAVPLPAAQVARALGQREVDGAVVTPVAARGLPPVTHAVRDANLGVGVTIYAMREATWQALAPAARAAVLEAGTAAVDADARRAAAELDAAWAALEARGVKLHRLSDAEVGRLAAAVAPLDDAWLNLVRREPAATAVLAEWRRLVAR